MSYSPSEFMAVVKRRLAHHQDLEATLVRAEGRRNGLITDGIVLTDSTLGVIGGSETYHVDRPTELGPRYQLTIGVHYVLAESEQRARSLNLRPALEKAKPEGVIRLESKNSSIVYVRADLKKEIITTVMVPSPSQPEYGSLGTAMEQQPIDRAVKAFLKNFYEAPVGR